MAKMEWQEHKEVPEPLSDQEVTRILHYLLSALTEARAEIELLRAVLAHPDVHIIVNESDFDLEVEKRQRRIKDETEGMTEWMQRISALRWPEVSRDMANDASDRSQS